MVASVLKTNRKVSGDIQDAALELKVVHAVLDTQVADSVRSADVNAAIERTEVLEKKLEESSQQLEDATAALESAQKELSEQVGKR